MAVDDGSLLLLPRILICLQRLRYRDDLWERRQQAPCRLSRGLGQQRIHDDQARHGLNDGHSARHDARVVTALGLEHARCLVVCHCVLGLPDGRGWLEAHGEVDVCAVADAALDASAVVRLGRQARAWDACR